MKFLSLSSLAIVLSVSAFGATVTLTMNEVPAQLIDGLAVTKGGVTFTFSNPARTLTYNSPNGGTITYVQDPSIEGTNSTFTVAFAPPVYSVQFGMAANITRTPTGPIATVNVSGPGLAFTGPLNAALADPFAEGQFHYSSATPISSITVTPTSGAGFNAIGFDNLAVDPAPASIPALSETGLAVLFVSLLAGGCVMLRTPGRGRRGTA